MSKNNPVNVLNFQNFKIEDIKWKKIERRGKEKYIIPLYTTDDQKNQKPLIFQTPKLYLPFKPDANYLSLSFYNHEYDPKNPEFEHFLADLDKYLISEPIQKKLSRKGFKLKKREIRSALYYPQNINYPVFLLHYFQNSVLVYNQFKERITWGDINERVYGYFIFELVGIWLSNDKYGFSFDLKQAKFYPPIVFDDYMFIDEDEPPRNQNQELEKEKEEEIIVRLRDYPLIAPYLKMMKIGIPKEGIKQKMLLTGVNPKLIDYDLSTPIRDIPEIKDSSDNKDNKNSSQEKASKDSQEEGKEEQKNGQKSLSSILSKGILGNHLKTLKKVTKVEDKPKKKFKTHPFPVPDLEEIQNAIQRLKKVDE